ncbi:MAG: BON domain-containing protein [Acidobacteria bacterium]|nr:BON domain-containing protein [Acidobacteriota bacterium]
MPQRERGDAWIIGLALGLGLTAVGTPIALRFLLPPQTAAAASSTSKASRSAGPGRMEDLRSRRLAFPGGCGANEFKDHRGIEAQIRRKLQINRLSGLQVSVSADCVATLRGVVRSPAQRELALRAASHPWTVLDARGLRIYEEPTSETAAPAAGRTEAR